MMIKMMAVTIALIPVMAEVLLLLLKADAVGHSLLLLLLPLLVRWCWRRHQDHRCSQFDLEIGTQACRSFEVVLPHSLRWIRNLI